MSLPWKNRKQLCHSLAELNSRRQRRVFEQRETNDVVIIKELEQEIIQYLTPLIPDMQRLMAHGLVPSYERRWYIYGIPVLRANVSTGIGFDLPNFELKGPEIPVTEGTLQKIKTREHEEGLMDKQYSDVEALSAAVINKFGSVKYLLTQFPELKDIFRYSINKNWKPNPSYKVPPRSSFENCDAFIHFLGGCAMEGIKP